VICTP